MELPIKRSHRAQSRIVHNANWIMYSLADVKVIFLCHRVEMVEFCSQLGLWVHILLKIHQYNRVNKTGDPLPDYNVIHKSLLVFMTTLTRLHK